MLHCTDLRYFVRCLCLFIKRTEIFKKILSKDSKPGLFEAFFQPMTKWINKAGKAFSSEKNNMRWKICIDYLHFIIKTPSQLHSKKACNPKCVACIAGESSFDSPQLGAHQAQGELYLKWK